jgi:gas vesicle protein
MTKDVKNILIGGIAGIVLSIFVIPTISDNYKSKKIKKLVDQIENSRKDWNDSLAVLISENAVIQYKIDSIKLVNDSITKQQLKDISKYQKDVKGYKNKINSVNKWSNTKRDEFWSKEFATKDSTIRR